MGVRGGGGPKGLPTIVSQRVNTDGIPGELPKLQPTLGQMTEAEKPPGLARVSGAPPGLARVSGAPPSLGRLSQGPNLGRGSQGPALGRTSVSQQRASVELSRRSVFVEQAKVSLEITSVTTGKPIVFKNDGTRFKLSNTLKLVAGEVYNIRVKSIPFLAIPDENMLLEFGLEDGHRSYDTVALSLDGAESTRSYSGTWKCTMPTSKKGQRFDTTMRVEFEQLGDVVLSTSIKAYKQGDGKVNNGANLKTMLVDCRKQNGEVVIRSENYVRGEV